MDIPTGQFIHGLIFGLGVVLIIGGIATGTQGAWIIGLIVAAVNFQQWQMRTGKNEYVRQTMQYAASSRC